MTTKTSPTNYLLSLALLFAMSSIWARNSDGETPDVENNIICFAAKKQWVCAPADEQHKAQEKAKKLALEPDQPEPINDGVEIQTLQPVNIGLQARESNPNQPAPYNIQDFVPREDAQLEQNKAKQPAEVQADTTVEVSSEPVEVEPITVETKPVIATSEPATVEPSTEQAAFQTAPNDFNYWQTNFAERWTFQVVGTSNRHHLDGFIAQNGLQNHNYTIARTQRDGADWWIVLVGLYNSRDEAKSQQYDLPTSIAKGAWVRQVNTIAGQAD